MHCGVTMFPTDYSIQPHDLAAEAEARGFESVWLPEHSHIPTSRKSPWPGGGELPKFYYDSYDPFVSLGAAAAVTKKIKLGFGICLVIERDPIHTAKEVSTLDRLSNGRVLFGIGGGWNAEEMANHGTAFETRFKLMRERIAAMKEIWTQSKPKYSGELVKFDEMMQWPKPVQKPHPPIIVGGAYPHAARRAVAYGDGWIPNRFGGLDPVDAIAQFRKMAKDAGRDPASLSVDMFAAPRDLDTLKKYRDAGVTRAIWMFPSKGRDEVLPMLDQCAALMKAL
ncbi:MAG: LLM class F420-dependent oxidoreductase [Hyphomicrobiales bacterium]|nr:LLM class F420-dependent oxidoreductase [Hyphomicrobiales bacterium]MBV8826314.1 LLM class F420-dependent oxidoreductase [Hyphomicrobiales bacterium]